MAESSKNDPPVPPLRPGVSWHPLKLAFLTGKLWDDGRTVGVRFLDGSKTQKKTVQKYAEIWSEYADITFKFGGAAKSEIRVSFAADPGSWSAVGTDCLLKEFFPKSEPTMNFGWLDDDTDEDESRRVVLHEFGHALGAIHEHQNPKGGIKWNLAAVYKYFSGPPNNWSKEEIDFNVVQKYSEDQLNGSKYDPRSIMLYAFPAALIKGGKATAENTKLSPADKRWVKKQYPK